YKDEKGKEIDKEAGVKLLLVSAGVYQELIDLYLDSDAGDFTDPIKGYDIKIKRTGKGMTDTEYTVLRGNPSKLDKAYRKEVDPEAMVKALVPTYEETKQMLEDFLHLAPEEEEEKSSKKDKKKKKKKSKDL